jgi:hypothetical protein
MPFSLGQSFITTDDSYYAAPIDRRAWKHSRQNTGRPCVGRKGTVVSLPHCEHVAFVSARIAEAPPPPPPPPSARLALHPLQRFGSFLKPLSAKNICSPPVNTNSAPHSEHFSTLSWYSMNHPPDTPIGLRGLAHVAPWAWTKRRTPTQDSRAGIPWGCTEKHLTVSQYVSLPDRGLIPEVPRRASSPAGINPVRDAASCAVASAKALLLPGASRRVSYRSCASLFP